nr:Flp family type IVb pilin [Clostridium sp.]
MNLINYVSSKVKNEEGQGMVEYALLAGLISIVAIVALTSVGTEVLAKFNAIVAALTPTSTP